MLFFSLILTQCPLYHIAIKRGRYTHAKKAENIREVKRLQQIKQGDTQLVLGPMEGSQDDTITESTNTAAQIPQQIQHNFKQLNHMQQFHIQNSNVSKALRCKEEELEILIAEISNSHCNFFGDFTEMRRQLPAIEARYLVSVYLTLILK